MRIPGYVLIVCVALLLAASIVTIVVLLDKGAQDAIDKVVGTLQRKTLELTIESLSREVFAAIPLLQFQLRAARTGWDDCATMDPINLHYYLNDQIRMIQLGMFPYIYLTTEYGGVDAWSACVCFENAPGDYGCLRPSLPLKTMLNSNNETIPAVIEEVYMGNIPMPMTPVDIHPNNIVHEEYVQAIRAMTEADSDGLWSPPYPFLNPINNVVLALQTLSIPLSFNNTPSDPHCNNSVSVDIGLSKVGELLSRARTSSKSTLFVVSPDTGRLVATSNLNMSLWTADTELWQATAAPDAIVRDVVTEYNKLVPLSEQLAAPAAHYTSFEMTLDGERHVVAAQHMRDRNLRWVVLEATPRSHYYATLDDSRVVSVTTGAVIGAVALSVTVLMFVVLIRALHSLGHEMDKLATLDVDDAAPIPPAVLSEVDRLVGVFNSVVKNMRLFKSLIPASVFQKASNNDDEEVEEDAAVSVSSMGTRSRGAASGSFTPTRRSKQSERSDTNHPYHHHNLKDVFALHVEPKSAVVAEVRLVAFEKDAVRKLSPGAVVDTHGAYITRCLDTLKPHKAVMGPIVADRLQFHWNVANKVAAPHIKAARGCIALSHAAPPEQPTRVALHSCKVVAGYMGTVDTRSYQLVGGHLDVLAAMFQRMDAVGADALCTLPIQQEAWTAVSMREVDDVDGVRVFELVGEAARDDDEWMYQLDNDKTNGAGTGKCVGGGHGAYAEAWTAWHAKQPMDAIEHLKRHVVGHEHDRVARLLLSRWEVGR
eukprot:PhM_4_TR2468/c1_g2_i10/m.11114